MTRLISRVVGWYAIPFLSRWSRMHGWRGGPAAQFLAAAADLASRLPTTRHVLNLCEDRYCFLVGFAAALQMGQISLLPSSLAANALRQVSRRYPEAYCLTDRADVPSDVPLFSFP